MKKIKLLTFILTGIFGFFLSVHSVLSAGEGCCVVTNVQTNKVECYKNYASKDCPSSAYKFWVSGDPSCSLKACQGQNADTTPTSKGCCSFVKSGQDTQCVTNKTESECRQYVTSNNATFNFWQINDTSCTVTREKGGCQASRTPIETAPAATDDSSGTADSAGSDSAASGSETSGSITFTNPLRYNTVNEFVTNILVTLRTIIVVLSIIFIVLGGIFYITSAGNEKRMTLAKGAITASMIGLAVGIAAPSFLKEIYTIMGGKSSSGVDTSQLTGPSLTEIALNFLNFLLAIVGVLTLIMLIIGGIMYLTSAGDEDRINTAKKIVTYSIIGIFIALASLVIVRQIANLLT